MWIVNVRLFYMSTDHKGMIALGKTLCKFYAQPVSFLRGDLAGPKGLAHMIGNHIIRTAYSSGGGNVLPLCQKELRIRCPAVTRIAGNGMPTKILKIMEVVLLPKLLRAGTSSWLKSRQPRTA